MQRGLFFTRCFLPDVWKAPNVRAEFFDTQPDYLERKYIFKGQLYAWFLNIKAMPFVVLWNSDDVSTCNNGFLFARIGDGGTSISGVYRYHRLA